MWQLRNLHRQDRAENSRGFWSGSYKGNLPLSFLIEFELSPSYFFFWGGIKVREIHTIYFLPVLPKSTFKCTLHLNVLPTVQPTTLAYRKLFENECISSELGGDDGKQILSWGSCIKDCPVEDFTPACEKPPPVPTFPLFDTVQTHYVSSWFKISSQKPDYKLTATRSRLHYPTWLFDSGNTTDDVEILVQVNF